MNRNEFIERVDAKIQHSGDSWCFESESHIFLNLHERHVDNRANSIDISIDSDDWRIEQSGYDEFMSSYRRASNGEKACAVHLFRGDAQTSSAPKNLNFRNSHYFIVEPQQTGHWLHMDIIKRVELH